LQDHQKDKEGIIKFSK